MIRSLALLALAFFAGTNVVLAAGADPGAEPLRVGIKPIEPFVMAGKDEGFSIDLARALGEKLARPVEFVRSATVSDLLGEVQAKKVDFGIAAITINADREEKVDFSHPIYVSGLQILIPEGGRTTIFSSEIMAPVGKAIGILLLALVLSAHILWLVERGRNPDFPKNYLDGVADAIWWAAVTVTTVGYGDKTPHSPIGRTIGFIWMFAGMFIVAYFTSTITSSLTVANLRSTIESPSDLAGHTVATASGTTSEKYLESIGIRPITYPTVAETLTAVAGKDVDAVVFDAPTVQYFAAGEGVGKVLVSGKVFKEEDYGIALPEGSKLRNDVNVALLSLQEDGTYDRIYERWFGRRQ